MAVLALCNNVVPISEFHGGFNGTCTQASAAMVLASAKRTPTTHDAVVGLMLDMTHHMINNHWCWPNGGATIYWMARELRERGARVMVELDYQGDQLPQDWHALIKQHAGHNPIILQLARAYNLKEATGQLDNPGVYYHAIAILGIADEGYYVCDPNTWNADRSNVIDIYTDFQGHGLLGASPCGLIIVQAE